MSRKTVAAFAALTTAAGSLLAAPAADAAATRPTTHVHVTKKHAVAAPARIRPGVVHLHNDGSRAVAIFQRRHEGSAQLVGYMNAHKEKLERRAFTRFGFVEILQPHADDYLRLGRGSYYLVDTGGNKARLSGVRSMRVTGKRSDAVRPAYKSLRISPRGVIEGASSSTSRPYVRLHNRDGVPRVIASLPIKASVTDAQLRDALADPSGEKIFDVVDFRGFGSSGLFAFLGGKQDVTTRTTLRPGRFVLTDFALFGKHANELLARGSLHLFTIV